jgi:hypothetical protein
MKRFHRKSRFSNGAARRTPFQVRSRRNLSSFREKKLQELKVALNDKKKVLKFTWKNHYLTLVFIEGDTLPIYGNISDALRILDSRLFYMACPCTVVNLYYFYTLNGNAECPALLFENKMSVALGDVQAKKLTDLSEYLQSDRMVQDIKRMLQ